MAAGLASGAATAKRITTSSIRKPTSARPIARTTGLDRPASRSIEARSERLTFSQSLRLMTALPMSNDSYPSPHLAAANLSLNDSGDNDDHGPCDPGNPSGRRDVGAGLGLPGSHGPARHAYSSKDRLTHRQCEKITLPVAEFCDRVVAEGTATMHQAGLPITVLDDRIGNTGIGEELHEDEIMPFRDEMTFISVDLSAAAPAHRTVFRSLGGCSKMKAALKAVMFVIP